MIRLWEQVLTGFSEAELDHGFAEYFRGGSTFMPKPGEIRGLILTWRADQRRLAQENKTQEYLQANRMARESGQTVSFGEIIKSLKDQVAKMPDIMPDRKAELRGQLTKLCTKKPTEDVLGVGEESTVSGKSVVDTKSSVGQR